MFYHKDRKDSSSLMHRHTICDRLGFDDWTLLTLVTALPGNQPFQEMLEFFIAMHSWGMCDFKARHLNMGPFRLSRTFPKLTNTIGVGTYIQPTILYNVSADSISEFKCPQLFRVYEISLVAFTIFSEFRFRLFCTYTGGRIFGTF